jgi:hypothetical protein
MSIIRKVKKRIPLTPDKYVEKVMYAMKRIEVVQKEAQERIEQLNEEYAFDHSPYSIGQVIPLPENTIVKDVVYNLFTVEKAEPRMTKIPHETGDKIEINFDFKGTFHSSEHETTVKGIIKPTVKNDKETPIQQ